MHRHIYNQRCCLTFLPVILVISVMPSLATLISWFPATSTTSTHGPGIPILPVFTTWCQMSSGPRLSPHTTPLESKSVKLPSPASDDFSKAHLESYTDPPPLDPPLVLGICSLRIVYDISNTRNKLDYALFPADGQWCMSPLKWVTVGGLNIYKKSPFYR